MHEEFFGYYRVCNQRDDNSFSVNQRKQISLTRRSVLIPSVLKAWATVSDVNILPPRPATSIKMDRHFADMLTDADRTGVPQHHHDHDHATEQHPNGNPHDGRGVHGKGDTTKSWPHGHDRLGARSVGIELTDGPIDWVKFKEWLKGFLEGEQERIWRLKGVLWTSARGSGASGYGTTTAWGWGAGSRAVVQV